MRNIDVFVCMRRYESLTLHEVLQHLKVNSPSREPLNNSNTLQITKISWLVPTGEHTSDKLSRSDFSKRVEILSEFLYYIFDSFLVPLIRSNFYVTESNTHKNRLFFFRHDVWRKLSEPSLATMKLSSFEEMDQDKAAKALANRPFGYSQVRLLPKTVGARPIMNLKRRVQTHKGGKKVLGRSINSVLSTGFNVLKYESVSH